ncbi:hypothetical protein BGZ51_009277 [Haplosporangium sp. Z 767]|nr:hypothetical protein BGZ50_009587 [Haplosporangium sp. Z 11]KAF9177040.1 hypothetical protein BGZ51_009277 [Haplosporangium sp. Z 767]
MAANVSGPTLRDEETETESENDLVDPRIARRLAASNLRTADGQEGQVQGNKQLSEGGKVPTYASLMKTLPIDVNTIDDNGLTEVQESITNAFVDLEDQLAPIDADHNEDGDLDVNKEQERVFILLVWTWNRKLERAKKRQQLETWVTTRAHISADERIVSAAKTLSIDIDWRIKEFVVRENDMFDYRLNFYVLEADFEDWLSDHEQFLGNDFIFKKSYKFRWRGAAWNGYRHKDHYMCQRYGSLKKQTLAQPARGDAMEEGVGGGQAATLEKRKRTRTTKKPSIKVGCHSKFTCLLKSEPQPNKK